MKYYKYTGYFHSHKITVYAIGFFDAYHLIMADAIRKGLDTKISHIICKNGNHLKRDELLKMLTNGLS